jgi:hypothetical protein
MLAESGLPELERSVIEFMAREKAKEFLLRVTERALHLLGRQRGEMVLRISAVSNPELAQARLKKFEGEVQCLRRLSKQLIRDIQSKIAAEMERRFKSNLCAWGGESLAAMSAQIRYLFARPRSLSWTRRLGETESTIQADAGGRVEGWFTECRKRFGRVLWEIGDEALKRLSELPDGVWRAAMEVFDLTSPHQSDISDKSLVELIRSFSFGEVYFEWEIPTKANLGAVPISWIRKQILGACEKSLARALSSCQGKILKRLTEAGIRWTEDVAREVNARIDARVQRVQQIMKGQVNYAGLDELERLLIRATEVRDFVSRWEATGLDLEPDRSEHKAIKHSRHYDDPAKVETCSICSSSFEALWHFLGRRQYELFRNETTQAAHSEKGGFCHLHTWQYAKTASPQGICAAYPRVLLSLAQKLRGLSIAPAAGLDADVRMLVAGPDQCAACRVVRDAEAAAVKNILAAPEGNKHVDLRKVPLLCLSHLALVLEAGIDPSLTRSLLMRQAQILDKVAEDMRNHALKHEALRRWLMTEEEMNAPLRGLTLLAGNSNLAAP